ncbi:MAG: AMP-binding protein [Deltaproteobacteria bacterium]|nr:AMP-binding protein [Deltaproteobacteria bacterium]
MQGRIRSRHPRGLWHDGILLPGDLQPHVPAQDRYCGNAGGDRGGEDRGRSGKRGRPGDEGEILIRGPNVMKGYYNRPEETAQALEGGWLHSGDVGRFDGDGYLHIVDRIKDLVITGGLNVYPTEVEEVLYRHDTVEECAVTGLPHPEYGEAVTAFVRLKRDCGTTEEELIRFCKESMASYKAPKRVLFVEDFPRTPQGKLLKRELRKTSV